MALTLFSTNGKNIYRNDPFALARELFGVDPFVPVARKAADATQLAPAFDVRESQEAYVIQADLPGVKDDALELTIDGDQLTIRGSRTAEERTDSESYHVLERRHGTFARTFRLPREVDGEKISAKLDAGVLTVTLPKKPEAKARKIAVK